jgi:hypothetical protein
VLLPPLGGFDYPKRLRSQGSDAQRGSCIRKLTIPNVELVFENKAALPNSTAFSTSGFSAFKPLF